MATVLVPLAQGCEELEAVTIIDLLRRAGVEVISAGLDDQPVRCSRDTVIIPDTDLDNALLRDYEMIVLPGGLPGADNLNDDPRIVDILQKMAANNCYTAAICAAPKVLADAGLLKGCNVTAYPGVLDAIAVEGLTQEASAVVCDGNIITSRGPGTAMDFALTLIEKLLGDEKRQEVEAGLVRM